MTGRTALAVVLAIAALGCAESSYPGHGGIEAIGVRPMELEIHISSFEGRNSARFSAQYVTSDRRRLTERSDVNLRVNGLALARNLYLTTDSVVAEMIGYLFDGEPAVSSGSFLIDVSDVARKDRGFRCSVPLKSLTVSRLMDSPSSGGDYVFSYDGVGLNSSDKITVWAASPGEVGIPVVETKASLDRRIIIRGSDLSRVPDGAATLTFNRLTNDTFICGNQSVSISQAYSSVEHRLKPHHE